MEPKHEAFLQRIHTLPKKKPDIVLRSLQVFHNKWSAEIIFQLLKNETMRFSELKKALPAVTNTMLTAALRDLEQQGIVHRRQFNEVPPHVEYTLTEKGLALLPVFYELVQWGKSYQ